MLTIRPAQISDFDALTALAAGVVAPDVSLPSDAKELERLIARSEDAFAADIDFPGEEQYLLVAVEPSGSLVGATLVVASAGYPGADYSFRNETIVHASRELGVNHRLYALTLSHELSGCTLLRPPVAAPRTQGPVIECTLVRAALCFIAENPQRFAEELIAPLPGVVDAQGESPFWSALGSKFFEVSYHEAERHALGKDRSFMAELMPHHPIYVPLLPESAQTVLGQTRTEFMATYAALVEEGFEAERFVDVFDGGPVFFVKRDLARTVHEGRIAHLRVGNEAEAALTPWLLANREDRRFRAVLSMAMCRLDGDIEVGSEVSARLELIEQDEVRCVAG